MTKQKDNKIKNEFYSLDEVCGYCKYSGHRGFLTINQVKQHQCLEKKCQHFIPQEGPAYDVINDMNKLKNISKQIKYLKALKEKQKISEDEKLKLIELKQNYKELNLKMKTDLEKCNSEKQKRDEKREMIMNLMKDSTKPSLERSKEIVQILNELQEDSITRPIWDKDRKGRVKKKKRLYKDNRISKRKKYNDKIRSQKKEKIY